MRLYRYFFKIQNTFFLAFSSISLSLLCFSCFSAPESNQPLDPIALAGKKVFIQKGCIACHKIGRYGGGRGPNLSHVWTQLTTGERLAKDHYAGHDITHMSREERARWWLDLHLIDPSFDNRNAKMPQIELSDEERQHLIAYLKTCQAPPETPLEPVK